MLIWSRASGATQVSGPSTTADVYGDLTWSADGRYLGWYEQPAREIAWDYRPLRIAPGADCGPGRLVVFDTADRVTTTWSVTDLFQPMVVTGDGAYVFENGLSCGYGLLHYLPSGRRVSEPVTGAPATGRLLAFADATGFLAIAGAPRPRVFSLALDGSARLEARLPAPTAGTYERFVASPDGAELAVEQGAQTQGNGSQRCAPPGLAAASSLVTLDLRTDLSRRFDLPPVPPARTAQIGTMSYGPAGSLDLTEYACSPALGPGAALGSPVLLQLRAGALVQVAKGVIAGETSFTGSLAVIPGRYELIRGPMPGAEVATAASGRAVAVDGAPLAGVGRIATDISWSPAP
ncbi:MAG TPA: hypothetical protein VEH29_02810 [Acidimicrobiales bacterium]|nr:hypothetical protein [Acidimicrobiales bacterium]